MMYLCSYVYIRVSFCFFVLCTTVFYVHIVHLRSLCTQLTSCDYTCICPPRKFLTRDRITRVPASLLNHATLSAYEIQVHMKYSCLSTVEQSRLVCMAKLFMSGYP